MLLIVRDARNFAPFAQRTSIIKHHSELQVAMELYVQYHLSGT